jgi:ketosteroid isomerase-like protein
MTDGINAEEAVRALLDAFNAADFERMRSLLADDLRAFVTNSGGGLDQVSGASEYLERIAAMDLPSARFNVSTTQLVSVRPDLVMVMVEVRAARAGRTLHNHAAHLMFIRDGKVAEWWMVEALPAESDAFWSA